MPPIAGLIFLVLLLGFIGWLVWKIFDLSDLFRPPCNHPGTILLQHLTPRTRYRKKKMAFNPGTSKLDTLSTNGDGILTGGSVVSSDPNIVAVTQLTDTTFRLDMLAVGHADLTATALNSAGATLSNTLGVDVVLPAGDTLTQTITDLT